MLADLNIQTDIDEKRWQYYSGSVDGSSSSFEV